MSKLTKRITAMLLSGMLVIGSVPGSVFAASTDVDPGQTSEIAEEVYDEEASEAPASEEKTGEIEETSEVPMGAGETSEEASAEEAQYYTVTLDANGGYFENEWDDSTGEIVEQAEVVEKHVPVDGTVTSFPVFVDPDGRTMVFAGWSLERDGELVTMGDEEYVPVENCTLFAVWDIEDVSGEEESVEDFEKEDASGEAGASVEQEDEFSGQEVSDGPEGASEQEGSPDQNEIGEDVYASEQENTNGEADHSVQEREGSVQEEESSEGKAAKASSESSVTDESESGDSTDSTPPIVMDGSYIWPEEAEEAAGIETVTTEATAGAEQTAEELVLHDDYGAAIQDIRDQAKIRKETVQVKVSENVKIQMDETGIWDDLFEHTGNPKEGDYLKYSGAYFHMDSCESLENGTYLVTLKFYSYYDSEEQEAAVDQEVERIVTDLQLNSESLDNYEKIKAIYAFITKQVQYDYETKEDGTSVHKEKFSAYGSIVEHNAVCQGYALMFYRLALEAGIDSRIITSESRELDDGGHAWNIVQLGDLYYLIDTTWDAGEGEHRWGYFLRGKRDFGKHSNDDDQFHDEVFSEQYPLSEHGFEIVKEWGTAPDYSMITWENKVISSAAKNGRAKVLVFGNEWCSWTEMVMEDFGGKSFPGVDIVFISLDVGENAKSYYEKIGNEFPLNIPGTYAACSFGNTIRIELEKMMGINDPDGWYNSPTVFMINSDNKVVYGAQGYSDIFENIITDYLVNDNAPEPVPDNDDDIYGDWTQIGFCGYNAIWRYYEDGTVRISGKGDLFHNVSWPNTIGWTNKNYQFGDDVWIIDAYQGWLPALDPAKIKNVVVDESIGNIGIDLFCDCTNLETITFENHGPDLDAPVVWPVPEYDTYRKISSAYGGGVMPKNENLPLKVYYSENDPTWNVEARRYYDPYYIGRWYSQDNNGDHHHVWSDWRHVSPLNKENSSKREFRFCDGCLSFEWKDGSMITPETKRFCGEEAQWFYLEDGLLYINGKGDLYHNTSYPSCIGWGDPDDDETIKLDARLVKQILVEQDIGNIGAWMFHHCINLEVVTFLNHGTDLDAPAPEGWSEYSSVRDMMSQFGPFEIFWQPSESLNTLYFPEKYTIYYPENDDTWTDEVKNIFGGREKNRWVTIGSDGAHHHTWGDWNPGMTSGTVSTPITLLHFCDDCGACEKKDGSIILPDSFGACGEHAQWYLYNSIGLLYLSGSGNLWGKGYADRTFNLDGSNVRQLIVGKDIGNLGANMFFEFYQLSTAIFLNHAPDLKASVASVGKEWENKYRNWEQLYDDMGWMFPDNNIDIFYPADDSSWTTSIKEKITTHNGGTSICIPLNKNGTIKLTSECAKVTGITNAAYTSKAIQPVPVVKLGTKTLKSGTDYTVSYKNNTNVGAATVTITGKGNYTGTVTKTFKINQAAQSITAKAAASSVAVGKTTTVSLTGNKGSKSFKSSDTSIATVTSAGKVTAKKVGTVKITATSAANANYKAASKTVTIKVVPAATASLTAANQATGIKLTWKKVTGATGYKVYRGSTLIKTITSGSTVTYADTKANTNGTKYTYKIVAKATTGDSTLSKSVTVYKVARPAVSSVTNSASKKMTVKWGKNAKANGYQIQYSTDKNFKSGNKAVSITSASTVSRVIRSLTKGKTYYVRIRTYKTVGSTKYWSIWSAARSVKISK